jgi:hypothetical protein
LVVVLTTWDWLFTSDPLVSYRNTFYANSYNEFSFSMSSSCYSYFKTCLCYFSDSVVICLLDGSIDAIVATRCYY